MCNLKNLALCFVPAAVVGFSAASSPAADGFVLKEDPGEHLDVQLDGKTIARYMTAYDPDRREETYKPYLHVMDADGQTPITKGPGGQYTHHRGIFIGWNRLTVEGKRYDLWHMSGGPQVHLEFVEQQADRERATFTSKVAWKTSDGQTLLEELRTFVFHRAPAPTLVLLDVTSEITAVAADAELNGDPEHAGIQYRPANEVDRKLTKYLFPEEGNDPRKDLDLPWVAENYTLDGKSYSVVDLNHPDNAKGSRWSAYRDYGRFGVFPKVNAAKGESVAFRYRFRVLAGEMPSREQVQTWWREYLGS